MRRPSGRSGGACRRLRRGLHGGNRSTRVQAGSSGRVGWRNASGGAPDVTTMNTQPGIDSIAPGFDGAAAVLDRSRTVAEVLERVLADDVDPHRRVVAGKDQRRDPRQPLEVGLRQAKESSL